MTTDGRVTIVADLAALILTQHHSAANHVVSKGVSHALDALARQRIEQLKPLHRRDPFAVILQVCKENDYAVLEAYLQAPKSYWRGDADALELICCKYVRDLRCLKAFKEKGYNFAQVMLDFLTNEAYQPLPREENDEDDDNENLVTWMVSYLVFEREDLPRALEYISKLDINLNDWAHQIVIWHGLEKATPFLQRVSAITEELMMALHERGGICFLPTGLQVESSFRHGHWSGRPRDNTDFGTIIPFYLPPSYEERWYAYFDLRKRELWQMCADVWSAQKNVRSLTTFHVIIELKIKECYDLVPINPGTFYSAIQQHNYEYLALRRDAYVEEVIKKYNMSWNYLFADRTLCTVDSCVAILRLFGLNYKVLDDLTAKAKRISQLARGKDIESDLSAYELDREEYYAARIMHAMQRDSR